jgi:hypothetical protein
MSHRSLVRRHGGVSHQFDNQRGSLTTLELSAQEVRA